MTYLGWSKYWVSWNTLQVLWLPSKARWGMVATLMKTGPFREHIQFWWAVNTPLPCLQWSFIMGCRYFLVTMCVLKSGPPLYQYSNYTGKRTNFVINKAVFQRRNLDTVRDLSYTFHKTKCQLPCALATYLLEGWCHAGDILNLLAELGSRRDKDNVSCPSQSREYSRSHVSHSCGDLVTYLLMVLWIWAGKGGVKRRTTSSSELANPFKDKRAKMKPAVPNNTFRRNTAPNFIHSEMSGSV